MLSIPLKHYMEQKKWLNSWWVDIIIPEKSKAILVVKCIIPSDSNFTYKGRFIESDFNLRSYASDKLKPVEIVTSYPVMGENNQNNNVKVKPVVPDPGTGDA